MFHYNLYQMLLLFPAAVFEGTHLPKLLGLLVVRFICAECLSVAMGKSHNLTGPLGIVASIWRAAYARRVQSLAIVLYFAGPKCLGDVIISENRNRGSSSWTCGLPCTM